MKPRFPDPSSPDHWSAAVRASRHPILALLVVNVAITLYAFPIEHLLIATVFSILLPAGALLALAQTFSTRVAQSNHGDFPRAERPVGYWIHIFTWSLIYVLLSIAPLFMQSPT